MPERLAQLKPPPLAAVIYSRWDSPESASRRLTPTGRMATKQCPCGNAGEPTRVCTCSEPEVLRYRGRLSGPLADRIDRYVTLSAVVAESLQRPSDGEPSLESSVSCR